MRYPKGTSEAEAMHKKWKFMPVSLAVVELIWHQVSSYTFNTFLKFCINLFKAFLSTLKTTRGWPHLTNITRHHKSISRLHHFQVIFSAKNHGPSTVALYGREVLWKNYLWKKHVTSIYSKLILKIVCALNAYFLTSF